MKAAILNLGQRTILSDDSEPFKKKIYLLTY